MSQQSLEQVLQTVKSPVDLLRNSQIGAYVYPVVPSEYTNWRDEQRAWRESAVLFDQSHHMAELLVTGPDAMKMLSSLATNSFANFPPDRAKQFAPCSYDGYVIGDVIMFRQAENEFNLVGRAPTVNWVQFHARDRRLEGRTRARRPVALDHRRQGGDPPALPLSGPGSERGQDSGSPQRRTDPGRQVLPHGRDQHQGTQGARAAARHGWCPRPRGVGTVRAARGNPRGDHRSGQGLRAGPGRRTRLRHQHAGVGLDSLATPRGVHRRQDEEVSRVAARPTATRPPARLAAVTSRTTSRTTT